MKLLLLLCLMILPGSVLANPPAKNPDSKKSKKELLTELRICKDQLFRRGAQIKDTEAALKATVEELAAVRKQNADLQAKLENEAAKTNALNRALDKSRAHDEELEAENAKLKKLLEARGEK